MLGHLYGAIIIAPYKKVWALPSDLLFLKLPFAFRPGLTDSRVSKSLGIRNWFYVEIVLIFMGWKNWKEKNWLKK